MEEFLRKKLSFLPEEKIANAVFALDILLNIIIIFGLVFIIRTYLISPFQVFGPSMCNTLNYINEKCEQGYGEYIIVNKAVYQNFFGWQVGKPQRGDVIVFHPPQNNKEFFIKRIIGVPGDTVKLLDGYVYIFNKEYPEGLKLNEPYLSPWNVGNTIPSPYKGSSTVFEVPEGHYFVLGDNRQQSSDSRSCFKENGLSGDCGDPGITPFLPADHIEGKAWVVLWPFHLVRALEDPGYGM